MSRHALGFNILAWNTSLEEDTYYHFFLSQLMGGCNGHASMELVVPDTKEYRDMLTKGSVPLASEGIKDELMYSEGTASVRMKSEEAPEGYPILQEDPDLDESSSKDYVLVEMPCLRVFFSFWGDPATKRTALRHRMVTEVFDRLCQFEGKPIHWSPTAVDRLKFIDRETVSKGQYTIKGLIAKLTGGLLGKTELEKPIECFLHNGTAEEEAELRRILKNIKQKETLKRAMLLCKKELDSHLSELMPPPNMVASPEERATNSPAQMAEKDRLCAIEDSEAAQLLHNLVALYPEYCKICLDTEIEEEDLPAFTYKEMDDIFTKLSQSKDEDISALEALGVRFGENPDIDIQLPIWDRERDPSNTVGGLDPKIILETMILFATNNLEYWALTTNCCKLAMDIMLAAIPEDIQENISKLGYALPKPNFFVQTPQAVARFTCELQEILMAARTNTPNRTAWQAFIQFWVDVWAFIVKVWESIFVPEEVAKPQSSSEDMLQLLQRSSLELMAHPERASYQKDRQHLQDRFHSYEEELQKDWEALEDFEAKELEKVPEEDTESGVTKHCERLRNKLVRRQRGLSMFTEFLAEEQTPVSIAEFKEDWKEQEQLEQRYDNDPEYGLRCSG